MAVMWYTDLNTATSVVQFGPASGGSALPNNASAPHQATQYIKGYGYHHTVELVGLVASTKYSYRVGDTATGSWSDVFAFTAADAADAVTYPFGVSIYGDMGWLGSHERPVKVPVGGLQKNWTAVPTRAVIEELKNKGDIDFVWHLGDIAYADDAFDAEPAHFLYEEVYSGFGDWFQNVTSVMPYMVSVGNHESECHSPSCALSGKAHELSNFSAYNARYHMPSASSDGVLNMWYSFNYGPIHFVSVNSETDFPGAGEENHGDSGTYKAGHFGRKGQYLEWLEADLKAAAANKAVRPWIIAGGHRPFGDIKGNGVEALFAEYGVDMYFAGHTHSYVRTSPVVNGTVETHHASNHYHASSGTTLVVVGGAGCDEMKDKLQAEASEQSIKSDAAPYGSLQYATSRLASGVLTVPNASALHWQLIASHDGEILDDLWITK
jgi:predicted phosphodiesterase